MKKIVFILCFMVCFLIQGCSSSPSIVFQLTNNIGEKVEYNMYEKVLYLEESNFIDGNLILHLTPDLKNIDFSQIFIWCNDKKIDSQKNFESDGKSVFLYLSKTDIVDQKIKIDIVWGIGEPKNTYIIKVI